MKKLVLTSVALLSLVAASTLFMSTQPQAADVSVIKAQPVSNKEGKGSLQTKPCHYPDDADCPLTAEQEAALDQNHDITPDQLLLVDPDPIVVPVPKKR